MLKPVSRLPGMADREEEECLRAQRLQDALQDYLGLHGYRRVDTPVLEPAELFLRKSAGDLASWMYTFTEPGGRQVALRPEFTCAVIRMVVERWGTLPLPARLQYAGPVFRYTSRGPRQFTQVGAELVGAPGPRADAEVVALACGAVRQAGVERPRLVLNHLGVVNRFLQDMGLPERASLFFLSALPRLKGEEAEVEAVRREGSATGIFPPRDGEGLPGLPQEAEEVLHHLLGLSASPVLGGRTVEEVLERLRRKLQGQGDPRQAETALRFCRDLARIAGPPDTALKEAVALAREWGLDTAPIALVEGVLDALVPYGLGGAEVHLDWGLARGIAYYTGLVFEVSAPDGTPLGGGGRYDGLVGALGGPREVPALGFALTLESLLGDLPPEGPPAPKGALVSPAEPGAYPWAVRTAEALREQGRRAEMWPEPAPLALLLREARARRLETVLVVEADGRTVEHPAQ